MSRQLILLAGLHKTGTTSIQLTCLAARPVLKAAGLTYPTYSLVDGVQESNHGGILDRAFRPEYRKVDQPALRAMLAKVLDRVSGRVLLAAEGVSVFDAPRLVELRDWLEARGFDVQVICHVRRLADWVPSMVAQRVKGRRRMTVQAALDDLARSGLVRWRVENILKVFPQADFRSFEAAAAHPTGLVRGFLESIGVPVEGIDVKRANETRSDTATRALSKFNETPGTQWQSEEFFRLLNLPGPRFSLTAAEVAPLRQLIDAEQRWLASTLGAAFAAAAAP